MFCDHWMEAITHTHSDIPNGTPCDFFLKHFWTLSPFFLSTEYLTFCVNNNEMTNFFLTRNQTLCSRIFFWNHNTEKKAANLFQFNARFVQSNKLFVSFKFSVDCAMFMLHIFHFWKLRIWQSHKIREFPSAIFWFLFHT